VESSREKGKKVKNMNIFLGIFVCTLLLVVFLFIAVRRQMKARNHKKLSINRILNYTYFCLGDIINILFFTLLIDGFSIIFGIVMNTANWAEINWTENWIAILLIFAGILLIIWGWGLILLGHFFVRPVKMTRNPKKPMHTYMNSIPNLFENTLYDLRLNGIATLIGNDFFDYCKGDLIFYSEGIGDQVTGRWILLRIISVTKRNKKLEIKAEPCKIISDGTIKIEDEMKKHNAEQKEQKYG